MDLQLDYINDGSGFKAVDPLMLTPEALSEFSIFEKLPQKKKSVSLQMPSGRPGIGFQGPADSDA